MTTSRQSGTQSTADNALCARLQREFRGRGVNNTQRRRESTAVMIRRVQNGLDPYENAPDPMKRTVRTVSVSRPAASVQRPRTAVSKTSAQQSRAVQPKSAAKPAVRKPAAGAVSTDLHRAKKMSSGIVRAKEVRVRQPFPAAAVTLLTMFTLMIMVLVFSFSQNYELSCEISALQNEARMLAQTERDLQVQLEERDDIRVIENIAVNELGMVKNDLVESRFVSISGGDRIELTEENETEKETKRTAGIFSTMLSAIGENFERLMEYID